MHASRLLPLLAISLLLLSCHKEPRSDSKKLVLGTWKVVAGGIDWNDDYVFDASERRSPGFEQEWIFTEADSLIMRAPSDPLIRTDRYRYRIAGGKLFLDKGGFGVDVTELTATTLQVRWPEGDIQMGAYWVELQRK